jgi:hypothetical protein
MRQLNAPLPPITRPAVEVIQAVGSRASASLKREANTQAEQQSFPRSDSRPAAIVGRSELTEGNIDNHHFYLRRFFDRFPEDAVGGSNRTACASRTVLVDWGHGVPIETDLDGEKKFFRKRGWVRAFFDRTGARAGDCVLVEETAPYRYRVTLERNGVRS